MVVVLPRQYKVGRWRRDPFLGDIGSVIHGEGSSNVAMAGSGARVS
jgi:hypothetical protein